MTNRTRSVAIIAVFLMLVGFAVAYEVIATAPVRGALSVFTELVAVGNRVDRPAAERLAAARRLCSSRYLKVRSLALGPEGGIVGLPRAIDKNFQAWREGQCVWVSPTKRDSAFRPVYQFIREEGEWRFDGPVAILRPWGAVDRTSELPLLE
jgi:hypothetical protein